MPTQAPLFIDRRLSERKVQMLRNLGIRWQILSALALPVLVLGLLSSQVTYQAFVDMREANQSQVLARAADGFAGLVNREATERALSVSVALGQQGAGQQLKVARAAVDKGLSQVRGQVNSGNSSAGVQKVLKGSATAHAQLAALRADVDAGKVTPAVIASRYTQVIAVDVEVPFGLANTLNNQAEVASFQAFGQLGRAAEALAQEQLDGATVILGHRADIAEQRQLGSAIAAANLALAAFQRTASASEQMALRDALGAKSARSADLTKARAAFQSAGTTRNPALTLASWTAISRAQIAAVTKVLDQVSQDGIDLAAKQYRSARTKLQLTLGAVIGATLLTFLLALALSRRISAPLRRLTVAATQIRDELPRLVERVQSDEEFELHLPTVEAVGRNEVSQLAAAFVDVNAVTVDIAREQTRLRAAVADMFVNVARRNHVLLSRQLAFIDQLERNEVNPDALEELFRLDHLATRMRRNAESLLVLAGIESGRRLREPMPLSDVARTATSEIEHYARVTLSLAIDPPIFAHLALPVAHLLAELLENATNFSDPDSTVVVLAVATESGVQMTVADNGLGLPAEELAEINARIQKPPTAEALSSQRLGFFVVGRLAKRLEVKVTLTSGRTQGTAVLIDLPASLFIPGSLDGPRFGQANPYEQSTGYGQPSFSQPRELEQPAQGPTGPLESDWPDAPARTPEPVGAALVTAPVTAFQPPELPVSAVPMPASFNPDALAAEAAAQPTWMPQPDAGSLAEPYVPDHPVASVPLSRRAHPVPAEPTEPTESIAPAGPEVAAVGPPRNGNEPTAPEPVANQWTASQWAAPVDDAPDWATPAPAAPAWASSNWAEAESEAISGLPLQETRASAPAGAPSHSHAQPVSEPAHDVPSTSLFSGFRSRRDAAAPVPPQATPAPTTPTTPTLAEPPSAPLAPVEPPPPLLAPINEPTPSPVIRTTAPAPFLESAHPGEGWFDAAYVPGSEVVEESEPAVAAAPELPALEPDRWKAWAEVAADTHPPDAQTSAPAADTFAPIPDLVGEALSYSTELPDSMELLDSMELSDSTELPDSAPEPVEAESYPGAWTPEPEQFQPVPGAWTPEPEQFQPVPGAWTPEPAADQPVPETWTPEPAADQPVAVTGTPEPYQPVPETWTPESAPTPWTPNAEPATETDAPQAFTDNSEENPEPPPAGNELGMRTLTAAIDILPQRTTIRTALRRGHRKGEGPVPGGLPFNGGFDPIVPAREFARREGFSEPTESLAPVSPDELTSLPGPDGSPTLPETSGPWQSASPPSPVERRQHLRRPSGSDGDERSSGGRTALASEALSELSRLSSYSPTSMPAPGAASLQHRPRREAPVEEPELVVEATGQRARTAANVRSMLAGFKAGVERGRTSPSANRPAGDREPSFLPQPRNSPGGRDE